MGVVNGTNNRILPGNSRAVDVARNSIDRITKIQNRRYDNAFQVQGFQAILYWKRKGGMSCLCHSKGAASSVLDESGNASPGVINELLTGSQFGILPYGVRPQKPFLTVESGDPAIGLKISGVREPSIFEDDSPFKNNFVGSPATRMSQGSSDSNRSKTYLKDGFSDVGPNTGEDTDGLELINRALSSGLDMNTIGLQDTSCAVCFGTGFVGGFDIYNGCRIVLDTQSLVGATVNLEDSTPTATGLSFTFLPVVFPRGAIGLDTLKVWNDKKVVPVSSILVDGLQLKQDNGILAYCDGKPHVLTVKTDSEVTITHLEFQYNQSYRAALFEFPKLSQSSVETIIEKTDPFTINMSPVTPNVATGDIITDSTYGKVFLVQTSNWWNDKRRSVLGWDCEVRPCQPQELYQLLPRRRIIQTQNNLLNVRPNSNQTY